MPLNRYNTRHFHKYLYGPGILETVVLLKREDGMNAANVTRVTIYNCRWSAVTKRGQQLDGDVQSDHRRNLHLATSDLNRAGVLHINPLYRFIDKEGRYWQPESDDLIKVPLMLNHMCVPCQIMDPIPTPGV